MHPQIRQVGPGSCPICGMALEPLEVSAEAVPNHELADMTRRFWIGLVLTLPVFIIEMGSHVPGLRLHDLLPPQVSIWIQFALATPVVLWAGWPFFQRDWASVRSGHLNMFTLIALGTGAAYLYSLAAIFAPGLFLAGFRMMGGTVNGTGSLVMRADTVGTGTVLSRIVAVVAKAQRSRAPIQRMADTVSGYFVPIVLAIAVAAFVAWAVWGPAPALAYELTAAVSVVIIACPCALGLATPMSIMVAVGKGAGAGVLIKSAESLERMEKVTTLVLDRPAR